MEIILARHGRPKLSQRRWIVPRQIADWVREYDEVGVFIDRIPSPSSETAIRSGCIVSSPLRRCVQSAQALAPSREVSSDATLREAGLPHTRWRLPWLPVSVWTLVFRIAWFCGYSANSESVRLARERARSAATKLIEVALEYQSVFVMGHGIMTALIAKELTQQGWVGPKRPVHGYWRFSVYRDDHEVIET
jgi:broad specificity phosphatase PhoE